MFKASDLGYYTRAHQFSDFPSSNVSGIIQRVTFPVLCTIQDDEQRLRNVYRNFLRLAGFVVFPLMVGMAALAHPLINTVLTPKWAFAGTLLQVICLSMMWYPIHSININLLQVKGRSDLFLKLEIIKKIVGVTIMCISVPFGIIAMCWGALASSLIALVINTHYTGKLINVGFFMQIRDLLPSLAYSFSMGAVVWLVSQLIPSDLLSLIVGIPVGLVYFFTITKFTGSRDLRELISFVKSKK